MKVCLSCGKRFEIIDWRCPSCCYEPKKSDDFLTWLDNEEELSGFGREDFIKLSKVEENNFWFKARNELLLWVLHKYFSSASTLLEIGCGTGFVLSAIEKEIPALKIKGGDIFKEGLSIADERLSRAELFQVDARSLPFDQEFDVVAAFDVIEHIEEDDEALGQMFQATKPGGGIILTVPQHPILWSAIDDFSFHRRRYTRKGIIDKIERYDYKIVRATSFVSLLLPLMAVSRIKQKMQKDFDPLTELNINKHLGSVLEKILGFERIFIKNGFSFPVGGSLLIVAKRMGG